MSELLKATQHVTKATKARPTVAKQTFSTSRSSQRWPSSMDDPPVRSSYGTTTESQTQSVVTTTQSGTGTHDLEYVCALPLFLDRYS